jgi:fluoride exporter
MELLGRCVIVGVAGAFGAVLRLAVATLCGRLSGVAFPFGTFVVNISGCLFLGWFLTVVSQRQVVSDNFRLAIAVGLVGAYTTFSTFAFETYVLAQTGAMLKAIVNVTASVVVGLLAVRAGAWLAGG